MSFIGAVFKTTPGGENAGVTFNLDELADEVGFDVG